MKKLTVIISVWVLIGVLLLGLTIPKKLPDDGRRHRVFILAGAGYAFSRVEGFSAELGAELRVLGDFHARLLVDYYAANCDNVTDGVKIEEAYGINLFALYKVHLSEMAKFNLKVGGHVMIIDSTVKAFGLPLPSKQTEFGPAAGLGFDLQFSNSLSVYLEGTIKFVLVDPPWTFVKTKMGLRIRVW